jgi:hypothetical protein
MTRRKAFLVGVDRYERREIPPLRGCVNDVLRVRGILKRYFGLTNEDIRVLVNDRATKQAILYRLTRLVDDAQEGDVLIFYFSGHGSQIRDRDGDELTDQLGEIICPHDMDWDENTFILDDDLDSVFMRLSEGVLLEVFLDSCHSGPGSRDLGVAPPPSGLRPDVRYLPPPIDIAARFEGEEDRLLPHRVAGCSCFQGRNVFWAAAGEAQTSAEDYLEGQVNGVFTYFGCRFIEENVARIASGAYTRQQLWEDIRAYLAAQGYAQEPELKASDPLRMAEPLQAIVAHGPWTPFGMEVEEEAPIPEAGEKPWTPFGMPLQSE